MKAIAAGFFSTWPGLSPQLINKHLPNLEATALGYMCQTYQGTRLTKAKENSLHPPEHINMAFTTIFKPQHHIYIDQTGHFPNTSSKGNKYVMILFDSDTNAILAEPLKSQAKSEMIRGYTKLYGTLTASGF